MPDTQIFVQVYKSKCSKCDAVCGDVLYGCRDVLCKFQLDVTCAWSVKILHRSHGHRLTVNRCSAGFSYIACGTEHRSGLSWARAMRFVYVCSASDFWLHPHCAALPNAIQHERHRHPLLLDYRARSTWSKCAICEDEVSCWGFYSCTLCDYHVHIMCVVSDDVSFEPVPLREALESRVPGLVHFPVPNEYTSIVRHIAKCIPSTSDDIVEHQHKLTLQRHYPVYNDDEEINDDVHRLPKCNGCSQFISPPLYTCSRYPKLFLHDCCALLPRVVERSPHMGRHRPTGVLIGLNSQYEHTGGISSTTCCNRFTNGFTYTLFNHNKDIICSLMPDSIMHAAHAKTHVLRSAYVPRVREEGPPCRCCNKFLSDISYNCTTCRNFNIHASCARLPATVRHVYDPHPLELITTPPPHVQTQMETFCDACEDIL